MSTNGDIGHGSTFSVGDSSGGTSTSYDEISDIESISFSGIEVEDIESFTMSATKRRKAFKPGPVDMGEVELTLEFSDDGFNTLFNLVGDERDFRVETPGGAYFDFGGYLKGLPAEISAGEKMSMSATFKISDIADFDSDGSGSGS
jgi:hypothetical protein